MAAIPQGRPWRRIFEIRLPECRSVKRLAPVTRIAGAMDIIGLRIKQHVH